MNNKLIPSRKTALPQKIESTDTLATLLKDRMTAISSVLPRHLTPERMCRIAINAASREPKLLECTGSSIIGSILTCATLGLEPGILGQAYLVPFFNKRAQVMGEDGKMVTKPCMEAVAIPGYRGLIDIARRSGLLISIDADIYREGDHFEYQKGYSPILVHKPLLRGERGAPIAIYAVATLRDGGVQSTVMTFDEVEEIRLKSQQPDGPAWRDNWGEMAKKTALKRLCKLLPASVELSRALALDDRSEIGESQSDIFRESVGDSRILEAEVRPAEGVRAPKTRVLSEEQSAAFSPPTSPPHNPTEVDAKFDDDAPTNDKIKPPTISDQLKAKIDSSSSLDELKSLASEIQTATRDSSITPDELDFLREKYRIRKELLECEAKQ